MRLSLRGRRAVMGVLALALALAGCEVVRSAQPIIAQKDLDRLVMGRFDADYVGTDTCLAACHTHDRIRRDFAASTMGAQMSVATGLPMVDCESCHGPGSLAVDGLDPERVAAEAALGNRVACAFKTLIPLAEIQPEAQSHICLKCHTANATFNLHDWSGGDHAISGVSCFDCHDVHAGPDLIVRPREVYRMCLNCHEDVEADFSLPTHHPVTEQRVICTDCHNPHGAPNGSLLRERSVSATCTRCHGEKEGPFVFEHQGVDGDCMGCHLPHGSVNDALLTASVPFLCLECHDGHSTFGGAEASFYTRCTDCHSTIHGTDVPSSDPANPGRFTQ